jgi:hypothetical protein
MKKHSGHHKKMAEHKHKEGMKLIKEAHMHMKSHHAEKSMHKGKHHAKKHHSKKHHKE